MNDCTTQTEIGFLLVNDPRWPSEARKNRAESSSYLAVLLWTCFCDGWRLEQYSLGVGGVFHRPLSDDSKTRYVSTIPYLGMRSVFDARSNV